MPEAAITIVPAASAGVVRGRKPILEQVHLPMRALHCSRGAKKAGIDWIRCSIRFHGARHHRHETVLPRGGLWVRSPVDRPAASMGFVE